MKCIFTFKSVEITKITLQKLAKSMFSSTGQSGPTWNFTYKVSLGHKKVKEKNKLQADFRLYKPPGLHEILKLSYWIYFFWSDKRPRNMKRKSFREGLCLLNPLRTDCYNLLMRRTLCFDHTMNLPSSCAQIFQGEESTRQK